MPMAYTFRLVLEDGAAADPPTFATGVWNWTPGETLFDGSPRYRIVDVLYEDDDPDVQGVFVVAPL
jgi:hypothetical protein